MARRSLPSVTAGVRQHAQASRWRQGSANYVALAAASRREPEGRADVGKDALAPYGERPTRGRGSSIFGALAYPVVCVLGGVASYYLVQGGLSFYLSFLGVLRMQARESMLAWAAIMLAFCVVLPGLRHLENSRADFLDGVLATAEASTAYASSTLCLTLGSLAVAFAALVAMAVSAARPLTKGGERARTIFGIRLRIEVAVIATLVILALYMGGLTVVGRARPLAKASPSESDRAAVAALIDEDRQSEAEDLQSLLDQLQLIALVEASELGMEGGDVPRVEARIMREEALAYYSGSSNRIFFNALDLCSGTRLYSNGYLARVVMHELAHARQRQILRGEVRLDDNRLVGGLDAKAVERWRREQRLYPLLALTYEVHETLAIERVADDYADSRMNEYRGKECLGEGPERQEAGDREAGYE